MPQAKTVHYVRTIGKISNGVLTHIGIETWKALVMHIDQLSTENGFSAPSRSVRVFPIQPRNPALVQENHYLCSSPPALQ